MIDLKWKCNKPGHEYEVELGSKHAELDPNHSLCFQDGTVPEVGINGLTNEVVLDILVDRMNFLNTKFNCLENSMAIKKLMEARMWLTERTREREARNVEGKHQL